MTSIHRRTCGVGLADQQLVDPEAVPLDLYPELFELLFGPLAAEEPESPTESA